MQDSVFSKPTAAHAALRLFASGASLTTLEGTRIHIHHLTQVVERLEHKSYTFARKYESGRTAFGAMARYVRYRLDDAGLAKARAFLGMMPAATSAVAGGAR